MAVAARPAEEAPVGGALGNQRHRRLDAVQPFVRGTLVEVLAPAALADPAADVQGLPGGGVGGGAAWTNRTAVVPWTKWKRKSGGAVRTPVGAFRRALRTADNLNH